MKRVFRKGMRGLSKITPGHSRAMEHKGTTGSGRHPLRRIVSVLHRNGRIRATPPSTRHPWTLRRVENPILSGFPARRLRGRIIPLASAVSGSSQGHCVCFFCHRATRLKPFRVGGSGSAEA
jgi:hypothetical protein